jgi:hypothetical protein
MKQADKEAVSFSPEYEGDMFFRKKKRLNFNGLHFVISQKIEPFRGRKFLKSYNAV